MAQSSGRCARVRNASIGAACKGGAPDRRLLVDEEAGTVSLLKLGRQGDAEQLLGLTFRLDQGRGENRLTCLCPSICAGEADLLGGRIIAFAAEFHPRRIDELRHFGCRAWRSPPSFSRG